MILDWKGYHYRRFILNIINHCFNIYHLLTKQERLDQIQKHIDYIIDLNITYKHNSKFNPDNEIENIILYPEPYDIFILLLYDIANLEYWLTYFTTDNILLFIYQHQILFSLKYLVCSLKYFISDYNKLQDLISLLLEDHYANIPIINYIDIHNNINITLSKYSNYIKTL